MARKALITGVSGQDGSYLTELLLSKGYEVYGLIRQVTQFTPDKYGYLRKSMENKNFKIVYGDCTDPLRMRSLVSEIMPDEIYNLAAQSHVGVSFSQPINTCEVTGLAVLHLLEAIRHVNPKIRFYTAGSSEMFGKVAESPQNENTKFHPRSPYGCAKVFAHNLTVNYREAYGIYAVSGILFNHESERRGESFVTRKITRAIGRIKVGLQTDLVLGNTDAKRDWGHAEDYVQAMWLMLQQDVPKDYVIGTGKTHTVQDFIEIAFKYVGLDPKKHIRIDESLLRPAEVDTLCADPRMAKIDLGWEPKTSFEQLVVRMVDHDVKLAQKEKILMGDE